VESNLNIKKPDTPKLNVETVSSAVFGKEDGAGGGSGESIKNIHKTLSKLSRHIRKSLIRIKALEFNLSIITPKVEETEKKVIVNTEKTNEVEKKVIVNTEKTNEVEKKVIVNTEKITRIKKILKEQKNNIGKKLPGSNQDDLNKSLIETNKILVQIQQELMRSSALRSEQEKNQISKQKKASSKAKLSKEESELEQSSKKLGSNIAKISDKILSPVKGIFGKIMDFVGTLALGFATNAIFEWLKDKENQEKVQGWFNWIKDHWKWVAAGIGVLFALPLVGAIGGVISTIGTLVSVIGALATPLLGLMLNPLFWAVLATVAGALAIPFIADKINADRRKELYGEGNMSKGLFVTLAKNEYGAMASQKNKDKMTDQEKKEYKMLQYYDRLLQQRQKTNQKLYAAEKSGASTEKISELEENLSLQDTEIGRYERGAGGVKIQGKSIGDLFSAYKTTGTLPQTSLSKAGLQYREKGGPVSAGTPYLVGERGPEIFSPNIDGSIVNNMRTEKIYEMITSKKRGRGGVNIQTLPTITNQMPPPEMPNMGVGDGATEVPEISSVNMADPYRKLTPMLYGITV
jgi:hypothetical protein